MIFNFNTDDFFDAKDNFEMNSNIESIKMFGNSKKNCKFSIIIPTFKRNQYLAKTIESALNQKVSFDYEIIIVDNNDDFEDFSTLEMIKKYDENKIVYFKNKKNLGMFGNWNRCIELANSDWILILHDDDTIDEHYLQIMVSVISNQEDIACVGCLHRIIDEEGKHVNNRSLIKRMIEGKHRNLISTVNVKDFYYTHPINIMGVCINKKAAIETGGFDCKWDPISDYVFLLNLAFRHSVKTINTELLNYRVAVNATLKLRHLIGVVEADSFLRKNINEKLKLLNNRKDLAYRSCYAGLYQDEMIKNWAYKLSAEENENLLKEYVDFNKCMNFKPSNKLKMFTIKFWRNIYNYYCRYIRK